MGNETVVGTARFLSEFLIQFPYFTVKDAVNQVVNDQPGEYQPWSLNPGASGGVRGSFEDIQNTMDGANGAPLKIEGGEYNGQKYK